MERSPRLPAYCLVVALVLSQTLHSAPPDDAAEAAKAVNSFAAAHYRNLASGNALTSPWSIQTCMAMTYAGAGGQTRETMARAFFYPADEAALHASFQTLRDAMRPKPVSGLPLEILIANRVFLPQGATAKPEWLAVARRTYGADTEVLDFAKGGAAEKINEWVNEDTKGKIPVIVPLDALSPATRLVIANASYFDLPWEERFTKELTRQRPFFVDPSHAKGVSLMFKQHRLRFAKMNGFKIAAVPYAGGDFQFVVFVPDAVTGLPLVETVLTADLLSACAKLPTTEVRLSLPHLHIAPLAIRLKDALTKLGAGVLFGKQADLTRMLDDNARVDEIFHRAELDLDEDGTKAATSTAEMIIPKNGHPHEAPHEVVRADHPFLYMIQHVPTGTCLCLGRLVDPAPDRPATPQSPIPGLDEVPGIESSPKKK